MPIERKPRGLIIAIENYPKANGLAQTLPGTDGAGLAFYDWLVNTKGLKPEDILFCSGAPSPAGLPPANKRGTTRSELKDALVDLINVGHDKTSQIFLFFSGHGFAWKEGGHDRPLDVLVASDFRSPSLDGDRCMSVGEIEELLESGVGGEDHYFFVDACRNIIPSEDTIVTELAIVLPDAQLGNPTRYRIYSSLPGDVAAVKSGFSDFLLKGLRGEGRAKTLASGKFWVKHDRLLEYLRQSIGKRQQVEGAFVGTNPGLIYLVPEPVQGECKLVVDGAGPGEQFDLSATFDTLPVPVPASFTGAETTLQLRPREPGYLFQVSAGGQALQQVSPPPGEPLDLYEAAEIRFQRPLMFLGGGNEGPAGGGIPGIVLESVGIQAAGPPPAPQLTITTFANAHFQAQTEIRLKNTDTGTALTSPGGFVGDVEPGNWHAELWFDGRLIRSRDIAMAAGDVKGVDLTEAPKSAVVDSIAAQLPSDEGGRISFMSETLGPVVDRDPALWLALIGAGRILQPVNLFSKMRDLPLETFDDVAPNSGVIYVLFGRERDGQLPQFGLGDGPPIGMAALPGMNNVLQIKLHASKGPQTLTLIRDSVQPRTYATCVLPNRATFLVFNEDESGRLTVQQFLLPLQHLQGNLPAAVNTIIQRQQDSLRLVRLLSTAQRKYFTRRSMDEGVSEQERADWEALLFGKWMEPLTAIMAGFEMLRRDRANNEAMLNVVEHNLSMFFGEIPDVAIFSALQKRQPPVATAIPLLRDSLLRLSDRTAFKLPGQRLDYDSPFSCWLGR